MSFLFPKSISLATCLLPAALSLSTSMAAPYAPGDVLMGFVTGAGKGADDVLIVRLGTAASFRNAFDSATNSVNFLNIGTQLNLAFDPGWQERDDLYICVFATTDSDTIGDTLVNLDPFRTIYASRSRNAVSSVPGTPRSTAWTLNSNTAITTTSGQMNSTAQRYAVSTADASNLTVIPKSLGNTLDEYTKPVTANSFTNLTSGIEYRFGPGAWGTMGDAGTVEAALDFYRLQAVNNVAGQYGAGSPIRAGSYKGTFTINQSGQVSFIAAGLAPVDGFNTWAVGKGLPTGVLTSDDRDNDGIVALVEYSLDLNPLAFDSLPVPTAAPGGLLFSFAKGTAAAADPKITYQIEASSGLGSGWTPLTTITNSATVISALLPSNDPSGRLFGRLKIVKNP